MKRGINFKLWALCLILAGALAVPALGQGKDGDLDRHREWRTRLAKELKLTPEKEAQFSAVADKYAQNRKEIYENLKKAQGNLKTAVSVTPPVESQVKQAVAAVTAAQDKLLSTYKAERDDELAMLSTLQQGQYLEILHKWRLEMYQKHAAQAEEKKPEKK